MKQTLKNVPAQMADSLLAALVALAGISAVEASPQFSAVLVVLAAASVMLWVQRKWGLETQHTVLLVFTGALAGLWIVQFGAWPAVLALSGWFIYLSRRFRASGGVPDNDVQTIRLLWDLGILALVWTASQLGHPMALLSLSVLLVGMLTVLVRIMAMHQAQLEETEEAVSRPTRSLLLPLLGLITVTVGTLGAAAVFPSLRSAFLLLLLTGLGLYILRLVWRDIFLQAAVILGFGGLLYLGTRLLRRRKRPPSPHLGFRSPLGHHVKGTVPTTFPSIDWGLILLVSGLLLALFLLLRERRRPPDRPLSGPALEVERQRIEGARRRAFHRPPSPLRRLVYRWLVQESRHGQPLRLGETLRRFSSRHRESPERMDLVNRVVRAYEDERYGLQEADPEVVQQLERSLREHGLLKP